MLVRTRTGASVKWKIDFASERYRKDEKESPWYKLDTLRWKASPVATYLTAFEIATKSLRPYPEIIYS